MMSCLGNLFALRRLRNRISMRSGMILCYLTPLWFVGAVMLLATPLKDSSHLQPADAFFFAVAAVTGSSLSTRRMSNFTTFQTVTLMFLMLLGGRVFVLALELAYTRKSKNVISEEDVLARLREQRRINDNSNDLGLQLAFQGTQENNDPEENREKNDPALELQSQALKYYNYIVICYLIVVQLVGIISVIIYLQTNPESEKPLRERGIDSTLFSVFTTISFFANCGYVQVNEGLVPFQKSPGLLWLFVFQMALGNTMFWPSLRSIIWALSRMRVFTTSKHARSLQYILNNPHEFSLFGFKQTIWITIVEGGLDVLQLACLSGLQWNTNVFQGLTWTQKFSTAVFQTFSTRTTGTAAVNMVDLSPTIIFIYALVMYIPSEAALKQPSASSSSASASSSSASSSSEGGNFLSSQIRKSLLQRSVTLLATTVVICIIENHNVVHDPLNFSILHMIFETISAYGNVGLSVGYSCRLRRNEEGVCEDVPYSLSGKWSVAGKLLLLPLMLLGRF